MNFLDKKNAGEINRIAKTMRKKIYKIKNAKIQLVIFFAAIYYAAIHLKLFVDEDSTLVSDIRMGIFGTFLFLAYMGTLLLPEPKMSRPHPLFWRLVQGFTFAYVTTLCFLIFLVRIDFFIEWLWL